MDRAYTADYQLIKAVDAVKGRKYFCSFCNSELHFYPGTKNKPHFRHGKHVPKEVKDTCELYSQNLGDYSLQEQEIVAQQCVRLELKKQNNDYQFELVFPLIQQSEAIKMQQNNMYFTYYCEQLTAFKLNTVLMLPARKHCSFAAPLLNRYDFYCEKPKYEQILGLRISGSFEPLKEGPIIFKKVRDQFISVPYRRLTLSGRFFVVSAGPLVSIHSDLEVINFCRQNNFFIYELMAPVEFSDDLKNWFARIIGYTLLSSTCYLDLIKPACFKKMGTTIEISSSKSSWLVTNIGSRRVEQRLILISPNQQRKILKVPPNSIVDLNLSELGDYLLYVDQEITEILTLRYKRNLEHYSNFRGNVFIDNTEVLFEISKLNTEKIKVETDLSLVVNTEFDINYELKHGGEHYFSAPIRIDIPTLWSVDIKKPLVNSNKISVDDIWLFYEKYHLYPRILCTLNELQMLKLIVLNSNFIYKEKLLYFIRRFGLHMPSPVGQIIKESKQ
ncbi:hypothetical protein ACQKFO_19115 [Rossellomorea sp. NPDC071047]|uniref:hypothetical protein n=1 Tax=Rossellomorea sp. NPDC071047 TaxID=3390675 RepID=UPI003D0958AC